MTRASRRPTGIQGETQPLSGNAERTPAAADPVPEGFRVGLGWRIALAVWLLGFGGLWLIEMWRFLSKLLLN
jgi:hypothetical protein